MTQAAKAVSGKKKNAIRNPREDQILYALAYIVMALSLIIVG